MSSKPSPDEQPKKQVAKQVVTEKRQYFVPEHNVSVDASDADEAVKKAKTLKKQQKEGDD